MAFVLSPVGQTIFSDWFRFALVFLDHTITSEENYSASS